MYKDWPQEIVIREYKPEDRPMVEEFRLRTFGEKNESLTSEKYNPDSPLNSTWLFFVKGELASLSACEASHFTGDQEIAIRICRYHILKKYRHCNAGFRMLPLQVKWARDMGFKVIYWTQNVTNKPLNALYQQKKIMPGKKKYFEDQPYKDFKLRKDILFKVSPRARSVQFIYQNILEKDFIWTPKTNVIPLNHDGSNVIISEALEASRSISYTINCQIYNEGYFNRGF